MIELGNSWSFCSRARAGHQQCPSKKFLVCVKVSAAALQALGGVPSSAWWARSGLRLEALLVFVQIQDDGNKLEEEKAGREHRENGKGRRET